MTGNLSTPLYDALTGRARSGAFRFHMPGHKGRPLPSKLSPGGVMTDAAAIDFTELDGTGNLYLGDGPIAAAEALTARACGAKDCVFLTGGASQGIMAALAAFCRPGDRILLDRNSHIAVHRAMALLDLRPVYLFPAFLSAFGITGGISPYDVARALESDPGIRAVMVTSPTYYGVTLDISGISAAAAQVHVPLIVDGAHGAHLPFIGCGSAVSHGAALEVASAHKTLPCLGQGAWLLSSGLKPARTLRDKTALFGTTSPSYAIMASLDLARAHMQGQGRQQYLCAARAVKNLRNKINAAMRFRALDETDSPCDPCRLYVHTAAGGLAGFEAAETLSRDHHIECEMADRGGVVLIVTGQDVPEGLNALDAAIEPLGRRGTGKPLPAAAPPPVSQAVLSPRQALFAPQRAEPLCESTGRICAQHIAPYPPGVPVVAAGEKIEQFHIAYLSQICYNINTEILTVDL